MPINPHGQSASAIIRTDEALRIVSDDQWQRVKRRQREQAARVGARVRAGLSRVSAKSTGRPSKHLLSGILKCGACSANLVVSNHRYVCASYVNGGASACASNVRVPRVPAEAARLREAETALSALNAAAAERAGGHVEVLMPQFATRYRRIVRDLASVVGKAPSDQARLELRRMLPAVTVEADLQEIRVWNEEGRAEAALLRTAGQTVQKYGSGGRI